ncbi:unnamed protein product, partial [Sphacelaria rigidula]
GDTELSFIPAVHKYVVTEPSSVVCPSYLTALATVQTKCGLEPYTPVYVASNSVSMEVNCSADASRDGREAVYVNTGLKAGDVHTAHTTHPE